MLWGPKVASIAAYFDTRKLFLWIAIISSISIYIVLLEHREVITAMDAMVATVRGVSFLGPPSQNTTIKTSKSSALSDSSTSTISTNTWFDDSGYDWQRSTEENYRSATTEEEFVGDFREFRRRLDRSYHYNYIPSRQALQDGIIRRLLASENLCNEHSSESATDDKKCLRDEQMYMGTEKHPDTARWIVFTAGVYGAGKSHTIGKLQSLGCFPPRSSFVGVDPDEIRRMLPEFSLYRADQAGAFTQKEAGMIAELLTDIALSSGKNVVVDGSLRDAAWHEGYFRSLRTRFGAASSLDGKGRTNIRIGILYVTAPLDEIYLRVEQRGASTGRAVPPEFLERSMKEVPEAIERLRPLVDFYLHVHNSQTKQADEESKQESEQDSLASFVEGMENDDSSLSPPSKEKEESLAPKSEVESTMLQEQCQAILDD